MKKRDFATKDYLPGLCHLSLYAFSVRVGQSQSSIDGLLRSPQSANPTAIGVSRQWTRPGMPRRREWALYSAVIFFLLDFGGRIEAEFPFYLAWRRRGLMVTKDRKGKNRCHFFNFSLFAAVNLSFSFRTPSTAWLESGTTINRGNQSSYIQIHG